MSRFKYKEVFCLMQYQAEDNPEAPIEWLWNSRDGVTPFIINSREPGGPTMKHINWQDDILALQYVPNIGQRVFIDLTMEKDEQYVRERIDRQWDKGLSEHYSCKAEAFSKMFPAMRDEVERHGPDIVVVDAELQRKFLQEREQRREQMFGRQPLPGHYFELSKN